MPSRFYPSNMTEVKIFLLFLLDNMKGPIDYTGLNKIIVDNVDALTYDFAEALGEMKDDGYVYYDSIDGEEYYMIGDSGHEVIAELYETLPPSVREDAMASVSRYVRITNNGIKLSTTITEDEDRHFILTVAAADKRGEFINTRILVSSRQEAERMRDNFENNPGGIYRGFLFALTGRLEYLS